MKEDLLIEFEKLKELFKVSQQNVDSLSKNIETLVMQNISIKESWTIYWKLINILLTSSQKQNQPSSSSMSVQQIIDTSTISSAPIELNSTVVCFADILKKTSIPSNPVLIVKPKNCEQNCETTLKAIKDKISPTKLKVKKIRHVANGRITIECGSKQAVEHLKPNAANQYLDNHIQCLHRKNVFLG